MKQRVIISATSDLTTDQRIAKVANTFSKHFDEVIVVGRHLKSSKPLARNYRTKRFKLLFNKGALFYANYNIRLFFYLLFEKHTALVSNDADTLLANFVASKIKQTTLFFDAHEYFSEVPELVNRPFTKRIWQAIESNIIPRLKHCYTVSEGIAQSFKLLYKTDFEVVRNVPYRTSKTTSFSISKQQLGLNDDTKIIIYQGAVNVGRGLEEAIEMMHFIDKNVVLIIAGDGDILSSLQKKTINENLQHNVIFTGRLDPEILRGYTAIADIGISIEKELGLSYKFALPNKLFDYIQANIPVIVSGLPYMKQIVERYNIGLVIENHDPQTMAQTVIKVLNNNLLTSTYKSNLEKAASELCWEIEEKRLEKIIERTFR